MSRASNRYRFFLAGVMTLVVGLALNGPAQGIFIKPDLVNIPVSRLVENLQELVKKNPKDVNLRFNLARVHAMAFAQKTDTVQVQRNQEKNGAWFGFTPKSVPFTVKKDMDPMKMKEAKEHLQKARQRYEEVLKMQPNHLPAQLGHAWLVEQSGKTMLAIKEYRDVIEKAWETEGKKQFGPLGGNFITSEAAGYLIPLLDKNQNKDEIKTLQERVAKLNKLPRPVTPVAIPLRDGLQASDLLNTAARVKFDADGSALPGSWTWINPNASWLVYDPHGKKKIDSALQLFGNVTFWLLWDNGYEAMRVLDDDGDGFLSGKELNGLAIWRDVNSDGISQPGEVKTLVEWGIVKLSCQYEKSTDPAYAAFSSSGVYFLDGTSRPTYDLILEKK